MKAGRDEAMADDLAAMRRYARALARNSQEADDVVQDALVRAMERHETFRHESGQPAGGRRRWLLAIVHNVFISGRRRAAAEARRNERFAETLMAHVDPEQEQRARLAQVARAFSALSDNHRAVLHLIVIEGLSYQDAADVLDVPIGTVMSRLARARAALQDKNGGKGRSPRLRVVGEDDD
jgi:RNA polymerase sigma-70 factor (ECF subfamily)